MLYSTETIRVIDKILHDTSLCEKILILTLLWVLVDDIRFSGIICKVILIDLHNLDLSNLHNPSFSLGI